MQIILFLIVLAAIAVFSSHVGNFFSKLRKVDLSNSKEEYLFHKRWSRTVLITPFFILGFLLMLCTVNWDRVYWPGLDGYIKFSQRVEQKRQIQWKIVQHKKFMEAVSLTEPEKLPKLQEQLKILQIEEERYRDIAQCYADDTCGHQWRAIAIIGILVLLFCRAIW